jgi:hypothetical protein
MGLAQIRVLYGIKIPEETYWKQNGDKRAE